LVGDELGILNYEDSTDYTRRAQGVKFLNLFRKYMDEVQYSKMAPGDVILFRDGQYPCHAAILGEDSKGNLTIIHAHAPRRKVIEEKLSQGDWISKYAGCFAYRGV
jgi:hypothetical protein